MVIYTKPELKRYGDVYDITMAPSVGKSGPVQDGGSTNYNPDDPDADNPPTKPH